MSSTTAERSSRFGLSFCSALGGGAVFCAAFGGGAAFFSDFAFSSAGGASGAPTRAILMPVSFSMFAMSSKYYFVARVIATPLAPARPVRPMRWM